MRTQTTRRPPAVDLLAAEVAAAQLPPADERRAIRERAGVSLRRGATALQVDPMTLLRWERGARPTMDHAIAYREFLDALEEAVDSAAS